MAASPAGLVYIRPLEEEGDEAVGAADVLLVGFAEGGEEGGFFDRDPVAVGGAHTSEKGEQAGSIAEGRTESGKSDERAGIRRMTDVAIWAGLDDGLAGMKGYLIREKAS